MTRNENPNHSSLAGMQGTTPYDNEEIAELRLRAWIEQGILIVSVSDKRLGERDRRLLDRIAEVLYGEGVKP